MKRFLKPFISLVCLLFCIQASAMSHSDTQEKLPSDLIGVYFGAFGGGGFFSTDIAQRGTAFLPESSGGALTVDARGKSSGDWYGFGGLHLGYEWLAKDTQKSWSITPAVEVEGYYFTKTIQTNIEDKNNILEMHVFKATFPARFGVLIFDTVVALTNDYITPYIGAGVGASSMTVHSADSEQIDPPEPGVNHFNSDRYTTSWGFAAQVKAGLRYQLFKHMRLFGEYRFLYRSAQDMVFGSTRYPTHSVTSNWNVRLSGLYYNMFSLGIDVTF